MAWKWLLVVLVVASCTTIGPHAQVYDRPIGLSAATVAQLGVHEVDVIVPETLVVSVNPNEQFPQTDIVWYEDPPGDRRAQVQAIVEKGVKQGVAGLRGPQKVDVLVVVRHFHAVTPRALNNSLPAWHAVTLDVSLIDPATEQVLARIPNLKADSTALTQGAAKAALERGETQKSRNVARIAQALQQWLASSQ